MVPETETHLSPKMAVSLSIFECGFECGPRYGPQSALLGVPKCAATPTSNAGLLCD